MAFQLTDKNFQSSVLEKKGVALVDFWAEWCGPCRMVGPIVEELAKEYEGKALIGKVDVDTNPKISQDYSVRSIPTILILKDGVIVDKQVGATSKAKLQQKLEAALSA